MKPLTKVDVLDQLIRLNDTWPRYDAGDEQFERMAHSFHETLQDLDAEAVAGGVGVWVRTSVTNRWPSPAQIREMAGRWIAANRVVLPHVSSFSPDAACQTCGAVPRPATLRGEDHKTKLPFLVERIILACHPDRHPPGSHYSAYPSNFVRWSDTPDDREPAVPV